MATFVLQQLAVAVVAATVDVDVAAVPVVVGHFVSGLAVVCPGQRQRAAHQVYSRGPAFHSLSMRYQDFEKIG